MRALKAIIFTAFLICTLTHAEIVEDNSKADTQVKDVKDEKKPIDTVVQPPSAVGSPSPNGKAAQTGAAPSGTVTEHKDKEERSDGESKVNNHRRPPWRKHKTRHHDEHKRQKSDTGNRGTVVGHRRSSKTKHHQQQQQQQQQHHHHQQRKNKSHHNQRKHNKHHGKHRRAFNRR